MVWNGNSISPTGGMSILIWSRMSIDVGSSLRCVLYSDFVIDVCDSAPLKQIDANSYDDNDAGDRGACK